METDSNQSANDQQSLNEGMEIDPLKLQDFQNKLQGQENLPMASIAGLIAALIGAGLWAAVTVLSKHQIGWMAIGVGILTGFAVGKAGKGISPVFGWVGAFFAFLGCAIGNLLSVCGFISIQESVPFLEVTKTIFSQPGVVIDVLKATFDPMDLLFYGIAMHQGYSFSFRRITSEEMATLTVDK